MRARAICAVVLAVLVAVPTAIAAPRSPYVGALGSIEGALRFAIERQPEGLAKSLAASERVCSLGQEVEASGDLEAAAADWSTLSQIVEQLDAPGLRRVEAALGSAIETVDGVETRFVRAWREQPARVRALRQGARSVRNGLRSLTAGFADLRRAFSAWTEHRCEEAWAAGESFAEALPEAMSAINRGMEHLWIVSRWKPARQRDKPNTRLGAYPDLQTSSRP